MHPESDLWEEPGFDTPYCFKCGRCGEISTTISEGVRDLCIKAHEKVCRAESKDYLVEKGEEIVTNEDTGGKKGRKPQRMDLLPWDVLLELAEHYSKGAEKYDDHNWRKGYDWSLSKAAAQRHLAQFWCGEDSDPETGTKHVLAAAFHCLTLAFFMDEHPDLDDRYTTEDGLSAKDYTRLVEQTLGT